MPQFKVCIKTPMLIFKRQYFTVTEDTKSAAEIKALGLSRVPLKELKRKPQIELDEKSARELTEKEMYLLENEELLTKLLTELNTKPSTVKKSVDLKETFKLI